jgi:hypothetical protein
MPHRADPRPRIALAAAIALALGAPLAAPSPSEAPVPKEWLTPAEVSGFRSTPSYDETIAFLQRLARRMPEMTLRFYGSSAAGRPLPLVIVDRDRAFRPGGEDEEEERRERGKEAEEREEREGARRPVVLVQNGIHAGEIDGKDASLMLLRDLALGRRRELLDAATLLILPIYNVDGHERVSPYNRPNQDGPFEGMGFRTTPDGLDLNRDYLKLQSPEARALAALVGAWRPDLVVDDHVTDGVDFDWVLTTTWVEAPQAAVPVDRWQRAHLPAVLAAVARMGHRNGPYVDLKDRDDLRRGVSSWVGQPRYSSGYFPLRNRPAILVEMHSYKPYRERVLANRDFLVALLAAIGRDPQALRRAVAEADERTVELGRPGAPPSEVAVAYEESPEADALSVPFYAARVATSAVTGQPLLRFTRGAVAAQTVPWFHRSRIRTLPRPRGYLVPPGWPAIEERLRGHGLTVRRLTAPVELEVETARLASPVYAAAPYQGLTRIDKVQVTRAVERRKLPAGTLWIPADQPAFAVAAALLEPESPDSLLAWGLLSTLFERKEHFEPRVLEGIAEEELKDPAVAADWRRALADPIFAGDPAARAEWWYRRTPYRDETVGLLPVFRATAAPALPRTEPWR